MAKNSCGRMAKNSCGRMAKIVMAEWLKIVMAEWRKIVMAERSLPVTLEVKVVFPGRSFPLSITATKQPEGVGALEDQPQFDAA